MKPRVMSLVIFTCAVGLLTSQVTIPLFDSGVEVQDKQDYDNWLQEQETFSDLIAKQKILENEKTKLAKK